MAQMRGWGWREIFRLPCSAGRQPGDGGPGQSLKGRSPGDLSWSLCCRSQMKSSAENAVPGMRVPERSVPPRAKELGEYAR